MNIVIDRIEDDLAILDVDGEIIEFPLKALPDNSKEGDLIAFVKLDNSELLQQAKDRIEKLKAMSQTSGDTIDL